MGLSNEKRLEVIEAAGLPFRPYDEFNKDNLDARQELYRQLAETIWNPKRLEEEASIGS